MKLLLLALLLFVCGSAVPSDTCPKCHLSLQKTGDTKMEYGKLLYGYACINDHVYWRPSEAPGAEKKTSGENESLKSGGASCECPVCGFSGYITGTIGLKKCINGHEFTCD